jgi:hypothetical protein
MARQPTHDAPHGPEHKADHAKPRRRRRSSSDLMREDPFAVNLENIPDDVSLNWKRVSNKGEEDPFYLSRMREQGWEPVDPREHPDWVPLPPGYDKPTIEKGGLILMERPKELTDEATAENKKLASRQVREAEQRLGMTQKGEMTRDHDGVRPRVQKDVMRMVVEEE